MIIFLKVLMMLAGFESPIWRLPNIQIQQTMEIHSGYPQKKPLHPSTNTLPLLPLPSPNSPFSRGSSTIPPQLDGIPNVSASRVTLRLLTALDDSTGAQGVEQSVAVTLYCRCPQTWGGDIVTTWIVPIQVNHVNFKMEQGWQRFHKVSVLKHCHGWNITNYHSFSPFFLLF